MRITIFKTFLLLFLGAFASIAFAEEPQISGQNSRFSSCMDLKEFRTFAKKSWQTFKVEQKDKKRYQEELNCNEKFNQKLAKKMPGIWLGEKREWKTKYKWKTKYGHLSNKNQRWAKRTGECESGNRAHIKNPPYYGAFQFSWPTARAAGFHKKPHLTSWHEQAWRAVKWKQKAGRNQWPVCG